MRSGAVVAAVALLASGLGAAAIPMGPVPEGLVEGHTVFTVIEAAPENASRTEYAAAVAVLVRERTIERTSLLTHGVLWFNDQYLVNEASTSVEQESVRYPCSGAVLAVNAGDPIPLRGVWASNDGATYVDSYRIVDPNDHTWVVDKWNWTGSGGNVTIWTVALLGDDARADEPDDGSCEGRVYDDGCPIVLPAVGCGNANDIESIRVEGVATTGRRDPGTNGMRYPCGDDATPCAALQYNAVLYFLLDDLRIAGADKDHRLEPGSDVESDVSGCHQPVADWPCPDADDDREGNSHAYNPEAIYARYDGRGNHGGSGGGFPPGNGTLDFHATRLVDIHYGVATPPAARTWRVLDAEGSTAPYHCHDDAVCGILDDAVPDV